MNLSKEQELNRKWGTLALGRKQHGAGNDSEESE
jgi:hypothetical protein